MQTVDNWMVVDDAWNEIEYRVPKKSYLEKQREIYDELEREDFEDDDRRKYGFR